MNNFSEKKVGLAFPALILILGLLMTGVGLIVAYQVFNFYSQGDKIEATADSYESNHGRVYYYRTNFSVSGETQKFQYNLRKPPLPGEKYSFLRLSPSAVLLDPDLDQLFFRSLLLTLGFTLLFSAMAAFAERLTSDRLQVRTRSSGQRLSTIAGIFVALSILLFFAALFWPYPWLFVVWIILIVGFKKFRSWRSGRLLKGS
jgi:hypothetical protein